MDGIPASLLGIAAVLLFTCFIKIFTALNIVRLGAGLGGNGFGIIVLSLSLALTLLVMSPQMEKLGGFDGLLRGKSVGELESAFRPFLEKHADAAILERLSRSAQKIAPTDSLNRVSFPTLTVAFLISELSEAFTIGLMLLVPFLVIDLLVVNVMMALNVTQLSAAVLSLPLKVLLFFAVDGWASVTDRLLQGYL